MTQGFYEIVWRQSQRFNLPAGIYFPPSASNCEDHKQKSEEWGQHVICSKEQAGLGLLLLVDTMQLLLKYWIILTQLMQLHLTGS